MKQLIVCSNHPVEKWEAKMVEGWDNIEWMQFPNVSSSIDRDELTMEALLLRAKLAKKVVDIDWENTYFSVQGEFGLCYELFVSTPRWKYIFPVTERVSSEEMKDGVVTKTSKFEFKGWR